MEGVGDGGDGCGDDVHVYAGEGEGCAYGEENEGEFEAGWVGFWLGGLVCRLGYVRG